MSMSLSRLCWSRVNFIDRPGIRHRWIRRGKPPEVAKSLANIIAESKWKDPELHYRVNIGYSYSQPNRKAVLHERLAVQKALKEDLDMEKAAKNRTLIVPLDGVYEESLKTNGPMHLQQAAEYFNVFQDLFGDAYFSPFTSLDVRFSSTNMSGDVVESRVYNGNQIQPREATEKPNVNYAASKGGIYTLALTSPDCHFTNENGEYLHWLVGNIPENLVQKGETLCDFLQPFPPKGVGLCRYIFVLYKQEKTLDFANFKRASPCLNLSARTFTTYDFYREYQDFMTPVGLAFFQSNWDQSLTNFFHNVLDMKEPVFEYDFPPITLKPQEWFPVRKPFNLYLDKYKHPQDLQKELLLEKLKERHPFKPTPKQPKFPLAHRLPLTNPSWLNDDIRRKRMREGKWKFM